MASYASILRPLLTIVVPVVRGNSTDRHWPSPFPRDLQAYGDGKRTENDPGCKVQYTLKRATRVERWSARNAPSEKQERRGHTKYQRDDGPDEVANVHKASR